MANQRSLFSQPEVKHFKSERGRKLKVAGLFAGIGGIELGLERAGHKTELLCEIDPAAREVLATNFPSVLVHGDITTLRSIPKGIELLTAGFPCQDLSQAGQTVGIHGERSGLIGEVFRLLQRKRVPWVLLENVPFMLQLQRGRALERIVSTLEELGYAWAYRVVDSRFAGVPQRRERVYLVASVEGDPRRVLLSEESNRSEITEKTDWRDAACGFYWTEGLRGLGWAFDAVPTLKGGSTIGIPSPPAIIFPDASIAKPDIRDAERLQGFDADWTLAAERTARPGHRWKLVGNAVTVDVANWLGDRLVAPLDYRCEDDIPLKRGDAWPRAAWGTEGKRFRSTASAWPQVRLRPSLMNFLKYPVYRLSTKAATGFMERAQRSSLRFPPGFLHAIESHIRESA